MVKNRARLVMWLLLIVILLMTLMTLWRPIEKQASDTAFLVASKRILDRANYFKQEWLLKKQPDRLELEEQVIDYSGAGWPVALDEIASIDCQAWLKLLYPETRVLEYVPVQINNLSGDDYFLCEYGYTRDVILIMSLKHNRFSVTVGFSSN